MMPIEFMYKFVFIGQQRQFIIYLFIFLSLSFDFLVNSYTIMIFLRNFHYITCLIERKII